METKAITAIKSILSEFARILDSKPDAIDTILVEDDKHQTYSVLEMGWENHSRVQTMPIFIRLKNGKVWIEEDKTNYPFVDLLVENGVSKSNIVLGFLPPEYRENSEFAVA